MFTHIHIHMHIHTLYCRGTLRQDPDWIKRHGLQEKSHAIREGLQFSQIPHIVTTGEQPNELSSRVYPFHLCIVTYYFPPFLRLFVNFHLHLSYDCVHFFLTTIYVVPNIIFSAIIPLVLLLFRYYNFHQILLFLLKI